jgi:hypothetical protein
LLISILSQLEQLNSSELTSTQQEQMLASQS